MGEYLIELYVSRGNLQTAEDGRLSACAAAAALTRRGTRVEYRRSILLASEETCFLLFDADTVDAVREMAHLAELGCDHISTVSASTTQATATEPERVGHWRAPGGTGDQRGD